MADDELPRRADVVVVGGGLIGCLSAAALARRDLEVVVLERAPFGSAAASRAAAGMLQIEPHPSLAMRRLCASSRERYPALVAELEALTGLSVGYRRIGGMSVAVDEASTEVVARELALHREIGMAGDWVAGDEARRLEPALAASIAGAAIYPDDAVVDPPRLLAAARAAAERAGAQIVCGVDVRAVQIASGKVRGLETARGTVTAGSIVIAAGSWSGQIAGSGLTAESVEPMRGQMLELRLPEALLGKLIVAPCAYLSPRSDGRVLVGATVERVGFEVAVTAGAAARLLAGAIAVVPALERAHLTGHWCGFRPRTPDEMPALGRGAAKGLIVATGHFRSGLVLAPLTAEIVAALVVDETPSVDLSPFDPARFSA